MCGPSIAELSSHLPVDALIQNGNPQIEWLRIRNAHFDDPFFHETVERIRRERPQLRSVYTDLDALLQIAKVAKTTNPSGFIFHTSRCGSTLVANACRALNNSRVISEAPVVDKLISRLFTDADPGSPRELIYLTLIKSAINLLSRREDVSSSLYVVKFACASILQITRIRRVWPSVPIVILYRHPLETMVSNLRNIPHWMITENNPQTAATILRVSTEQLQEMSKEEFCARALGRYYSAAEAVADDPSVMLLNYDEISLNMLQEVFEFFACVPSPEEKVAIEQATKSHSKDAARQFHHDGLEKRLSASAFVVQMAEKWALPAYRRLTELDVKSKSRTAANR